jgi:hypothetical protein
VLNGAAWVVTLREPEASRAFCSEALAIHQQLGNRWGIAWWLFSLGSASIPDDAARALLDESLSLFRELGDPWGMSKTLFSLG